MKLPVTADQIASLVHIVRGQRVMLDSDLARLYGVSTGRLNEQVTRNLSRFPTDFMFELTRSEASNLISQIAISSQAWGGRRKIPRAFTEHGVVMLASILRTRVAIETSVQVVRAFIQLRGVLASQVELARRVDALEARYDGSFKVVFDAIRELMTPPQKRIGF